MKHDEIQSIPGPQVEARTLVVLFFTLLHNSLANSRAAPVLIH